MKKFDVRRIAIDAAFSAISVVLYCFLKFKLPIFPSFLEFNLSMLPILIIMFTFGTADSIIASFIRMAGKLLFVGTSTSYIGELADLLIAIIVCLIANVVYKLISKRTKKESIRTIVTLSGVVAAWTIGGIITNWLILVPAYIQIFMDGHKEYFVGACDVIPGINNNNYMFMYLTLAVLPFNALISIVLSAITYGVHMATYVVFNEEKVTKEEFEKIESENVSTNTATDEK